MRNLKFLFLTIIFFVSSGDVMANNLSITIPTVGGTPTVLVEQSSGKTVKIQFNIKWENSWRYTNDTSDATYPNNDFKDAVWVFAKYYDGTSWKPVYFKTTGYNMGTGNVTLEPKFPQDTVNANNDVMGVFLQRSASSKGSGPVDVQNVQLVWNWGSDFPSIDKGTPIKVRIFGIEMAYIPTGPFQLGNGSQKERSTFYAGGTSYASFPITSTYETNTLPISCASSLCWDNASTVTTTTYTASAANAGSPSGSINNYYPKGYKAFYMMKYEISQGGFVDFLNTLKDRTQQASHTQTTPAANNYIVSGSTSIIARNYIRAPALTPPAAIPPTPATVPFPTLATAPVQFGTDLDGDGRLNEIDANGNALDGQDVACNYLQWTDFAAYLAWAGLRPMTELEFEKAARGPLVSVLHSFAWGSAKYKALTSSSIKTSTGGTYTETVNELGQEGVANFGNSGLGPLRSGFAAAPYQSRIQSGAGYYGVMDLSGNLWEMVVTANHGTTFHENFYGNGVLSTNGNAMVQYWPGAGTGAPYEVTTATGSGLRGGSYVSPTPDANGMCEAHISDRSKAAMAVSSRSQDFGGRGVRVAP